MKFHLDHTPKRTGQLIDHRTSLLLLGSCFAENIGMLLRAHRFDVSFNPGGILFNPASICSFLEVCLNNQGHDEKLLLERDGRFYSYAHHSSISAASKPELLDMTGVLIAKTRLLLHSANFLVLTFGSAFIYHHKQLNTVVANCHKQPGETFEKKLLEVDEIVQAYDRLIKNLKEINPAIKIIFTVSPVKYLRDGVEENNLSKATLILAVHKLAAKYPDCFYFPAYELVNDDLRDYRFYKEDLAHPNQLAIDYIWEKFSACFFDAPTRELNSLIHKLNQAEAHVQMQAGPLESEKLRAFIEKQKSEIKKRFPAIDLD